MTDYRFLTPGTDSRFPGGGVDNFFDNGGRFAGGKDLRFTAPGLGTGGGSAPASFPADAFTTAGGFMVLDAEDDHGAVAIADGFAPSDVDTAANTINLPHRGFGAYTTQSSAKGTRGWLGTTGTLPAIAGGTLTPGGAGNPGTIVYRVDLGAGKSRLYREAGDADHAVLGSAVQGELIRKAQRYAEAVDPIDFIDGGSGAHTFHTWPLTNTLTTKTGGYTVTAQNMTDPNNWFEIVTIGGRKYIFNDSSSCSPYGSYRSLGKIYYWADAALSQAGANKRWLWAMSCVRLAADQDRSVLKLQVSSGVNISTDTITAANPFTTGDAVKTKASPGSSVPGGLEGTTYIRVSGGDMTFHPSNADALAGTNKIDLTSTGGTFLIYALGRTGDVAQHRMRFVSEYGNMADEPGGYNLLTPRAKAETSRHAATAVSVSGAGNGQITSGWASFAEFDGAAVRVWYPEGSTGPTISGGSALPAGLYYASREPGGGSVRLHATLQSAVESIGVAAASSSCLKFSAQGVGEFHLYVEDTFCGVLSHWGDSDVVPARRTPYDHDVVWSSGVDMNKPGETYMKVMHGVNVNVVDETLTSTVAVRDTGSYKAGSKPGAFVNSGAAHVALNGYLSALCWFAGTGDPDTTSMQAVMDWMAQRNNVRVAPTNTSAPTITADPSAGSQITGQIGTWTGPAPWSWAFQWQRADDALGTNVTDIVGATSIRYTPSAGDVGKHLRLRVRNTNRSGTTTAFSSWSNAVPNNVGQTEMLAFVARLSADPVAGFKTALQAFYADLINNSLLTTQDRIAAHFIYGVPTVGGGSLTVADALLNLAGNNTGAVTGNLVWTAKSGAESVDTTGYIDSGLDPSTGSFQYQRNSASLWELLATAPAGNTSGNIGNTNARANINPRLGTGTATLLLNATSGTVTSAVQTTWDGFWAGLRRSSTEVDFIHDAATLAAASAQSSQVVSAGTMRDFRSSGASSKTGRIAASGFGSGLTISQAQTLRTALLNFQEAVAAL